MFGTSEYRKAALAVVNGLERAERSRRKVRGDSLPYPSSHSHVETKPFWRVFRWLDRLRGARQFPGALPFAQEEVSALLRCRRLTRVRRTT